MSHFVVMVVGEDIDSILEPYDENMEVMEHMDRTKEQIHKEFIDFQGSLIAENKPKSDLTPFEQLTLSLDKETDTWSVGWCGQHLDADGNTLSTYNPDSKWDWYQVGGRWSGMLILKPGREGSLGQRSWTNEEEKIPENCVDGAYNKDIDWDAMNEIAKKQMADAWDELFDPNPDHCQYRPEYVEKQRKLHLELYGTKEEYIAKGYLDTICLCNRRWVVCARRHGVLGNVIR